MYVGPLRDELAKAIGRIFLAAAVAANPTSTICAKRPRDTGGSETFSIGAFLENPPAYVPGKVVRQVREIVAGFDEKKRERVQLRLG